MQAPRQQRPTLFLWEQHTVHTKRVVSLWCSLSLLHKLMCNPSPPKKRKNNKFQLCYVQKRKKKKKHAILLKLGAFMSLGFTNLVY